MHADLKNSYRDMADCVHCGLCQNHCPVFIQTGIEADGPRGRLTLLLALSRGALAPRDVAPYIAGCLLCGKCEKACPRRIGLSRIFLLAKFTLRSFMPLAPEQKLAARILALPSFLRWSLIFGGSWTQKILSFIPQFKFGKILGKLPPLSPIKPALPARAVKNTEHTSPVEKNVLIFSGCLSRLFYPEIITACRESLKMAGFTPIEAPNMDCCGRPLAALGMRAAARRKALNVLGCLAKLKFDFMVSPCPGCLNTILTIWPRELDLPPAQKKYCATLAEKVFDINFFMAEYGKKPVCERPEAYYWQNSCLMTAQNASAAKSLCAGHKIYEPENDLCCGSCLPVLANGKSAESGSAWWNDASLQAVEPQKKEGKPQRLKNLIPRRAAFASPGGSVAKAALDQLLASRLRKAIAPCPGCMLRLGIISRQTGVKIELFHTMQIYHAAIREHAPGHQKKPENGAQISRSPQ